MGAYFLFIQLPYTQVMKAQHSILPVQELASGETLLVHAYTYTGSTKGPFIYLQANVHGPEICGTAILMEYMRILDAMDDMPGKITIVPCANPMAVNQVTYNSMIGRFNMQSGSNWNRIFTSSEFSSHEEEALYFTAKKELPSSSTESRLAATLRSLSSGAQYVLDIHTTGSACAEHLFTHARTHADFAALGVRYHIELPDNDPVGAFDESHVIPFLKSLPTQDLPRVATWEVHHHGDVAAKVVTQRLAQLTNWIKSTQVSFTSKDAATPASTKEIVVLSNALHLYAPAGGYYSWKCAIGDTVTKDAVYAHIYQPASNSIVEARATRDFVLLGTYGVGAQAQGEQIGLMGIRKI